MLWYLFSLWGGQKLATFWGSIDFPGGSELNRSAEGPLNGAKMTVMDKLEFRDINGPDPYNDNWFNKLNININLGFSKEVVFALIWSVEYYWFKSLALQTNSAISCYVQSENISKQAGVELCQAHFQPSEIDCKAYWDNIICYIIC